MLPSNNIQSIVGATLYGPGGEKIGRIAQVFVDAVDGHPTWAEVHVGTLGRHATFVPLDDAAWEHDEVTVPFTKELVKNAPRPDATGGLDVDQETDLRRHFGAAGQPGAGPRAGGGGHAAEPPGADGTGGPAHAAEPGR